MPFHAPASQIPSGSSPTGKTSPAPHPLHPDCFSAVKMQFYIINRCNYLFFPAAFPYTPPVKQILPLCRSSSLPYVLSLVFVIYPLHVLSQTPFYIVISHTNLKYCKKNYYFFIIFYLPFIRRLMRQKSFNNKRCHASRAGLLQQTLSRFASQLIVIKKSVLLCTLFLPLSTPPLSSFSPKSGISPSPAKPRSSSTGYHPHRKRQKR